MENASKALIMAGGILIAIMVASLFVYLFTTYGSQAKDMYDRIYERQKTEALNEYTQYEGTTENTIYDVVTVINKAQDNNESLNLTSGQRGYITVKITNGASIYGINNSSLQTVDNEDISKMLDEYAKSGARFSCNVVSTDDGLISSVVFKVDHYDTGSP